MAYAPMSALFALKSRQEAGDFFQIPNVVCNSRLHRWRATQRLMNAAKIVIHKMKRERQLVVFKFLAECVRETGESSVAHSQREILTFNKTG
jgi:hypothetical protein